MIDPADVEEIDKLEDQLSEVKSKTLRTEYDLNTEVELALTEEEKGEWRQNQKAYGERVTKHLLNQQKAFAILRNVKLFNLNHSFITKFFTELIAVV
jgi:hypothetical protein